MLRPTWLPSRFEAQTVTLEYVHEVSSEGWRYRVGYAGPGDERILVALGTVNSGPPTSTQSIVVRGEAGTLTTTSAWPPLMASWTEAGQFYSVQASGVSRDELLQVIASLQAVTP